MTTFRSIEAAIHDLSEAERLAEAFGWPQETIDRINLLKRGAIHVRSKMVSENNRRALERLDNLPGSGCQHLRNRRVKYGISI